MFDDINPLILYKFDLILMGIRFSNFYSIMDNLEIDSDGKKTEEDSKPFTSKSILLTSEKK